MSFIPQHGLADLTTKVEDQLVAYPMHTSPLGGYSTPHGYNTSQIRTAYNLPSSGGLGVTIAIIDAFDTPNLLNDFMGFSSQFGLPDNSTGNFLVHKMAPSMATNTGWAMETCLDVEWAHAIAPNATILLVEATSDSDSDLLLAIDYATSQTGVIAVSMSWGTNEFSQETSYSYESHFNKPGITFFAASGDDGLNLIWPAVSPNVVSVGGTTLNLSPNGTVISETAWSNSSGGSSSFESRPIFQTNFGLTYPNRAVPDVSYNGNPATGVSVYNGTWWTVGGTSAGAPQWAAIHALTFSATNANLYGKAKLAYSSYFRDITNGSSWANNATVGYDLVTGLGSPLTDNFGLDLSVSPTSGPASGLITLNGKGFTANNFVNISYLNPLNSSWVPLANNVPTTSTQNFTCSLNAPDLLQNNTSGDNQPLFDNITFRAQDNGTSTSYSTIIPYTEWRRGLTQVGDNIAAGLYGNNTNRSAVAFVQNNQSMTVAGEWFSPGNLSLLWDGTTSLGSASTDGNGFFNATVQVPTTSAGQHMFTINDRASNFVVNITRLPTVANDYTAGWHINNVTINLIPDFNVNETFYRINNGSVYNITVNGQPVITTAGNNNTLEYWSTWNVYGTGNMELQHVILDGIQLETASPNGSIQINNGGTSTSTTLVTLNVNATDSLSGINQIRFSNDGVWDQVPWEQYTNSPVSWALTSGDGTKTVYCQIEDKAGVITTFNSSINFSTPYLTSIVSPSTTPTPTPVPSNSPAPITSPTSSISSNSTTSALPQYLTPTETASPNPFGTPQAPELSIQMLIVLLALFTLPLAAAVLRKRKQTS